MVIVFTAIANVLNYGRALALLGFTKLVLGLVLNAQIHFMSWDETVWYAVLSLFFINAVFNGVSEDSPEKEQKLAWVLIFVPEAVIVWNLLYPHVVTWLGRIF